MYVTRGTKATLIVFEGQNEKDEILSAFRACISMATAVREQATELLDTLARRCQTLDEPRYGKSEEIAMFLRDSEIAEFVYYSIAIAVNARCLMDKDGNYYNKYIETLRKHTDLLEKHAGIAIENVLLRKQLESTGNDKGEER